MLKYQCETLPLTDPLFSKPESVSTLLLLLVESILAKKKKKDQWKNQS